MCRKLRSSVEDKEEEGWEDTCVEGNGLSKNEGKRETADS
jgi:hypothetical protein